MNTTPTNICAILLVVCRFLPPNYLIPTEKLFLFLFSRWDHHDVVCLCIHWVVQNTKQHPFLIHTSVYTICVLFLFLFLSLKASLAKYGLHSGKKAAGKRSQRHHRCTQSSLRTLSDI